MRPRPWRNLLIALPLFVPLFILGGCAGDSDIAQVTRVLGNYISGSNEKITREQAAAIPSATMGLELGRGPQGLLILGVATESELDWYAGEQVFVATRRGRIIRTSGLPYNLGGLQLLNGTADIANARPNGLPSSASYMLDFPDLGVYSAIAQCAVRNAGEDIVDIFGAGIATFHLVEKCSVPSMKWDFENEYWIDRMTFYVWRSSQHIHPRSPPAVLQVFRPEQMGPG